MTSNSAYFVTADGHTEIRYHTEGIAPVFAEAWFQKIQREHDNRQAKFAKVRHVMDVTTAPLHTDNDIPDAIAAEIINEQLETAAASEQDAAYEAELAAKCAAIVASGLQIVDELRVGDELFSWHKSAFEPTLRLHSLGYVMTETDAYGRVVLAHDFSAYAVSFVTNVNKYQRPFYVRRPLVYQWSSANTRHTEFLAAEWEPERIEDFWQRFPARLDAIVDTHAVALLTEGENSEQRINEIEYQQAKKMAKEAA